MLLQAAKEHSLDLSACWMFADAGNDRAAGENAGCKTDRIIRAYSGVETAYQVDIRARDPSSPARKILRFVRDPIEILSA
jgi:hypothetical protein